MDLLTSIASLKQGTTPYGPAPHKPVMLLAIIEAYEKGVYSSDKIYLTPHLISLFDGIWNELVQTGHTRNFALPFFHLKNEKGNFWNLVPKPGQMIPTTNSNSIKSFRALVQTVAYAQLSPDLHAHLTEPVSRKQLKEAILTTYFRGHALKKYTDPYVDIQESIAAEPDPEWIKKEAEYLTSIKEPEKRAYEHYIRDGYFSERIRSIYRSTCAISRLHCEGTVSLVDACHIQPYTRGFNNSFRNGIALTPTLHRAFDYGLISIDDNYKVVVKPDLKENQNSAYHLSQFQGKAITDVVDEKWLPSQEYLRMHREKWGF